VLLHQPPSHLIQNRKPFNCKGPAPGGQHRLWPPLHVGLASARWLRSTPPELEATNRHPVGHPTHTHPKLRFPWPTHCVTHSDSLSGDSPGDSPPALLGKLIHPPRQRMLLGFKTLDH
jgi:hypothetical protein